VKIITLCLVILVAAVETAPRIWALLPSILK
jgi:hypothetical protein